MSGSEPVIVELYIIIVIFIYDYFVDIDTAGMSCQTIDRNLRDTNWVHLKCRVSYLVKQFE